VLQDEGSKGRVLVRGAEREKDAVVVGHETIAESRAAVSAALHQNAGRAKKQDCEYSVGSDELGRR
jgi:hypothetical protein